MMFAKSHRGIHIVADDTIGHLRPVTYGAVIPDVRQPDEVIVVSGSLVFVEKKIDWFLSDEYRSLEAEP